MSALQEGRRSTCRRHGVHLKVCRATSRRLCCSHCTDRPVLARAAGSSTILTGIDQSINPEQLGALAVRSACRSAAIVRSCGRHGCIWVWRAHYWCSACACMVFPCCMCVVRMHYVDTVGSTADKERSERSKRVVSWTSQLHLMLDGEAVAVSGYYVRLCEIHGDE